MKIINRIYIIILSIFSISVSGQVELSITGINPYPVFAQNYLEDLDVFTARIKNNNANDLDVKVYASVSGPLSIISREPDCILTLPANTLKVFNRTNYEELCVNFNINDLMPSLPLNGLLPEGNYSYCIELKDATSGQLLVTNCLDFSIDFPDPPVLLLPSHESTINGLTTQNLNITWQHVVSNSQIRNGIKYAATIVSMGENNNEMPSISDATILLNDASISPFYRKEDAISTEFVLFQDLAFVSEHYYAVRITVSHENFEYPPSQAQSNVVIFKYFEEDGVCGQTFNAYAIYPSQNSTIPFNSFIPVLRYEPYCDGYSEFEYDTQIKENGSLIVNNDDNLKWSRGPRKFLIDKGLINEDEDLDGYFSSHISTGKYDQMPALDHGKSYTWDAEGYMKTRFNKTFNYHINEVTFNYGMPKLKLNYPTGGELIPPGNVNFSSIHDNIPNNPLPPFKVKQIKGGDIIDYPPLEVMEHAVIQVSKKTLFDTLLYAGIQKISGKDIDFLNSDQRTYNVENFISSIYKDINFNHDFTDTLKLYWRIGWASDDHLSQYPGDLYKPTSYSLYNVSDVDSFQISLNASTTTTSNPSEPENQEGCNNLCISPVPQNTTDYDSTLSAGDEITVGKFQMEIVNIQKSGTTYTGEGVIEVPFIREVNAKVVFNNIKINTDKVVYDGTINGKQSGNELESLNTLLLGQTMEMPFGWDTTINNIHLTAGITELTFNPTNAYMEMSLDLGDALSSVLYESDNYPNLATNVCFTPGGFEKDVYFYTQNTITLDENDSGYGFELKGGNNLSDTISMTYVRWGCEGFKELQLGGAVIFSQNLLVKDPGTLMNDNPINERVRGHFTFKYTRANQDFMITARMEDFQFKNHMNGWGFDTDTIFIDLSDTQNPPSFEVPEGYNFAYLNNPVTINTWKGVYVPRCKVLSPKDFVNANRSTMGLSTLILGDGIYYLRHRVFNVLDEGIIGKMSATIDTIDGVISNIDFRYYMSGKVRLPFVGEDQHLKFSGLYNDISDWNLLVKVGSDSLEVPVYLSYMKLYENSFIKLTRQNVVNERKYVFTAFINGHFSLDDRFKPANVSSRLKNMNLKVLKFEDMQYESGKGFTNPPTFALASPGKSLNGFPLQLDSIAFTIHNGNPGIYLKPKLTLGKENSGFSGSVGMIVYSEISFSGPKDEFFNPGLFLSDLAIDAAYAGFTLKGSVQFIDSPTESGFDGKLYMTTPGNIGGLFRAKFGTYKASPSAPFNTVNYYSYWYVDALIAFGKQGIPVFSGINLYGLGGGMWYNMYQDPNVKMKPSQLYQENGTPANVANVSGIPYSKSFGGGYGFKIQGLFGDSGGGDKINMLLALSAQFPVDGGPIIKLRGDYNMMSKLSAIQDDGKVLNEKKAFWGYAEIELNMQEDFVSANFVMKAKMTVNDAIVVRGIGSNYEVVEANFFAKTNGDNFWYLYIGSPENRAGVKLGVNSLTLEAQAYVMMGHGVPNITPQPSQEFMNMLNATSSSYTQTGGDVNNILNKNIPLTAYGIAFGSVIRKNLVYNYTPFKLNILAILGFDFNITKDGERKCVETGITPGYEDWYATGQLYAGIRGSFGIHVDLLFIEGDYNLFTGSIAMLMKGGFPSPSWFTGRGNLYYKVLDYIEGSHSFEFTLGQKCTIGNGNPFSDMDVIVDTDPKNNDKDISVFTHPEVAYALKMNRELSFYDEKVNKYRIFKLVIDQVKLKNTTNNFNYSPEIEYENDNFVSMHKPIRYLYGSMHHNFYVKVKAKEKLLANSAWTYIKNRDGSIWSEDRSVNFITGPKPDSLTSEQIHYTYPMEGQNYFLKNETTNNKGIIRLNNNDPELFYTSKNNFTYHYLIEFSPTNGDPPLRKLADVSDHRNILFDVSDLQNNTKYIAKLIRKKGNFGRQHSSGLIPNNLTYATVNYTQSQSGEYNYTILPAKIISLGNKFVEPDEKKLYQIYFKTSMFDNLSDKLNAMTWSVPSYSTSGLHNIKFTASNPVENFDVFEMEGYSVRPSSDPNGSLTQRKGFVQSGIYKSIGENFGEEELFRFLNTDYVINQNKYKYDLVNNLNNYITGLNNYVTTQTAAARANLKLGISKTEISKMVEQNYQGTQAAISLPNYSSGTNAALNNSNLVLAPPGYVAPAKLLNLKLIYGNTYLIHDVLNKMALSDIMYLCGSYLYQNKRSLYNSVNSYINTPPYATIEPCKPGRFGIIYKHPFKDGYGVVTKEIKNYTTPGSCDLPDID